MNTRNIEKKIATGARLITLLAVLASTLGAIVMILIGIDDTITAIQIHFGEDSGALPPGDASAIQIISSLDRFLMAIVLLYFAYGVYMLFVRPGDSSTDLGVPKWMHMEGIGQLKQTVAEVIVVVLFVLFLRVAVETYVALGPDLAWKELLKLLILPVSIFLLAASLKLAELHPKSREDKAQKPDKNDRAQ